MPLQLSGRLDQTLYTPVHAPYATVSWNANHLSWSVVEVPGDHDRRIRCVRRAVGLTAGSPGAPFRD